MQKETKLKEVQTKMTDKKNELKIDGIYTARDLYTDVMDLYAGKTFKQYSVGFKDLEPYLKILKPSFNIFTGTPNSGKSSLTLDIMMRLAKSDNMKFLLFSPESELGVNLQRVIEKYLHKPFASVFPNRATEKEVIEALAFIQEHFFFVDRKGGLPDVDWILERAKFCVDNYSIDGLLIDPYNELSPMRTLREDEHISMLISKIKRFNRETNTITFLVAHPTKQIRNTEGKFEVKSAYDISGGAMFNNKGDTITIVTRDFENHVTQVRVCKVREDTIQGSIGECTLKFNPETRCYEDTGFIY